MTEDFLARIERAKFLTKIGGDPAKHGAGFIVGSRDMLDQVIKDVDDLLKEDHLILSHDLMSVSSHEPLRELKQKLAQYAEKLK